MKEPEMLKNIAKEQWQKEIKESHIRNRMGYIEGEQWAKQRETEQKGYVRNNLEKMLNNLFCTQLGAKSEEELWQIYDKLKEIRNNQEG